eukprot:GILI01009057.1.p1 GENE.GILI01009057.1~~GILI01009057.1.p1  ORF type:complete len:328 (-),score=99.95 GILI01009057.1:68-994(-)
MPAKKIVDDDEVVVKKPTKKPVADDEEAVVKKPAKKAVAADDEAVTKKVVFADPTVATSSTAAAPARRVAVGEGIKLSTGASSSNDAWTAPDYDDMTFEQFKRLLQSIPMTTAMAQKSAYDNQQVSRDADASKTQIEAFMDDAAHGYQYNDMLSRATVIKKDHNMGLEVHNSVDIPPPQMEKSGTKRNVIANFAAICAAIGRPIAEVQKYFDRETSTQSSIDADGALIVKMKLDGKGVERIFDKYMAEWITCNVCKSIDTTLEKEKGVNRLYFIRCNKCKAFRGVELTESAFAANTTKRSKLRNAGRL